VVPHEVARDISPTEQQQAIEKQMLEQEQAILDDLETTDIFKMKQRIKNYIENNVRLNRIGLKNTIKHLREMSAFKEKEFNVKYVELKM
jgi:t-SNARE complex subunit (syntaxin)